MSTIPAPNPNANDAAACVRKRRYSFTGARQRVTELAARDVAVTPYHCPECSTWHLTSMGAAR